MTKYICKCGRVVQKSTNADNTGNRNTANCEGCPYLLPWGPYQWDDTRHAMVTDVKGYECRMSPTLDYATYYQGGGDDKCVLHIYSLDYDFLDRVTAWTAEQFPEKEIRCSFDRSRIRAAEFSGGLYSMSVCPMPNKKGIAAKAALLAEFFGPDKRRRDMTPEEEKAHILAAIEAGKARAQKKEDKALTYKDLATGWLYRVSPKPVNGEDVYGMEYLDPKNSTVWKPDVKWNTGAVYRDQGHLQEALEARARRDGWEPVEENVWKKNAKDAQRVGAAVTTETSAAANGVISPAIVTQTSAEKSPAPASHADAGSATQSLSAAEPASLEAESPRLAFDYSGLDAQTVADLHLAEREYAGGKKMAEMGLRRMADAVAIAHDALCGACDNLSQAHNNQYSENTFGRWCESMGLNRKAAERLLQVSKLMDNSTPREQKVLEELSPSLLYAAAKPSAPAEVVQAVKDGDITTHKQYQEAMAQLKAEREAREEADRRADEAQAWAKKAEQEAALDRKEREDAHEKAMHYKAECDRRAQEQQRVEGLLSTREEQLRQAQQEAQDAARTIQRKQEAIEELDEIARDRLEQIEALEKGRTIEAQVSDPEEVRRQAEALALELAATETAGLQEENRRLRSCAPAIRQAKILLVAVMAQVLRECDKLEADDEEGSDALIEFSGELLSWSADIKERVMEAAGYEEDGYDTDES